MRYLKTEPWQKYVKGYLSRVQLLLYIINVLTCHCVYLLAFSGEIPEENNHVLIICFFDNRLDYTDILSKGTSPDHFWAEASAIIVIMYYNTHVINYHVFHIIVLYTAQRRESPTPPHLLPWLWTSLICFYLSRTILERWSVQLIDNSIQYNVGIYEILRTIFVIISELFLLLYSYIWNYFLIHCIYVLWGLLSYYDYSA